MSRVTERAKENDRRGHRECYAWYVAGGICPYCKKRYPEPGRVYCLPCRRYTAALAKKRDPDNARNKAYCKQRRERLKAAGLCVECGRTPAADGKLKCKRCAARAAESQIKFKILQRMDREAEEARRRNE